MTKSNEKVNKTKKIEMKVTPEIKDMAKRKAEKAGYWSVSAWLTAYIRRAR